MQHLLKTSLCSRFANNKISQIIQKTSNDIKTQQATNYLRYQELFLKLYRRSLTQQKRVDKNLKIIESICLFGDYPCKKICQFFMNTSKNFSQQYVVQALVRLAKAYKINQSDNAGTADYSGSRLFFTPPFQNIIEQFKYGLQRQHSMLWRNVAIGAQSLLEMGYIDYEVIHLIINLVQRKLNKQQRPSGNRPFQIQKRGYYRKIASDVFQNLVSSEEVSQVLNYMSQKLRSSEFKKNLNEKLANLEQSMKKNDTEQFVYNQIMETVKNIQNFNSNVTKLLQSIITVRLQYRKMVERSKTLEVQRDPELNLQLLSMEQYLLTKKLINFSDIKNPENIENEKLQNQRIQQILFTFISQAEAPIGNQELSQFLINNKQSAKKKYFSQAQAEDLGKVLNVIARLAQAGRKLKNAPDSRSLISMKWQKTLISIPSGTLSNEELKQNLHVQKIFRRSFMEAFTMITRNMSILMFSFVDTSFRQKLLFADSLLRIGLYEEAINILNSQNFKKQNFEAYSKQQLAILMSVFSAVGKKIKIEPIKNNIFQRLQSLLQNLDIEQNKPVFSLQFNINTLNYIVQHYNVKHYQATQQDKSEVQLFYNKLVQILQNQVKYLEESETFLTNQNLYEAYSILSFQKPSSYKLDNNFYSRYGVDTKNKKQLEEFLYKRNPYYSLVEDMCKQFKPYDDYENIPFIPTGYSSNQVMNGVLICNSNQTSIQGKHTNGNINGLIARIKRQYQVQIDVLAVNALLKIDYSKIGQEKQFKLKDQSQIQTLFKNLFKRDEENLLKFTRQITAACETLQSKYKHRDFMPVVKFLITLNQLTKLKLKQNQIGIPALYNFRRYRLFVTMDTLISDFNLIGQNLQNELNLAFKNISGIKIQQNPILAAIQSIKLKIVGSIQKNQLKLQTGLFQGKRYSIQTLEEYKQSFQNIGHQLIDTTFYTDKTFCQYSDWRRLIQQNYTITQLKLDDCSNVIKILANKFLPKVNQTINILPIIKRSQFRQDVILTDISLTTKKDIEKQVSKNYTQVQIQSIKQLFKYIHQLKTTMNINQICDFIFSFDFIERLLLPPINRKIHTLPRNESQYFEALQMKNDKQYLESPHLKYILNKMEHRQTIKELFQLRNQERVKNKIQYQRGIISRQGYYAKIDKVDNQIITEMKKLQNKLLGSSQHSLRQPAMKMVTFQNNLKEIERMLNRTSYYDRKLDRDFIHSKGDYKQTLKIKRVRAQKLLVLSFLINKLSHNVELTHNENEYLKNHFLYLSKKLQNQLSHEEQFSKIFCTLKISDLSNADLKKLKLKNSDLSKFENLALSDFILEIVNLIDPKVTQNLQKLAAQRYYTQRHNIPKQVFLSSSNKQFTNLVFQEEKSIINEHSKLKEEDISLMVQMTKVFKAQSFTGGQKYEKLYQDFVQNVKTLNQNEARVDLISQYVEYKQMEFYDDYDPKLVRQMKSNEADKLWKKITTTSYEECSQEQLKQITKKLCERLSRMTNRAPPFFGLFIVKLLSHPKIDELSKQNLIASLEIYKVPLSLDSEDILQLGKIGQNSLKPAQIIQKMKEIGGKNFMSQVGKKIHMIV